MKATKQWATPVGGVFNDDAPFDSGGNVKPLVRINNLREVEDGLFELQGVKPRNLAWLAVAEALGFDGAMPDALADEIGQCVFRHDIREFLVANLVG